MAKIKTKSGTEITAKLTDELSVEVERGYDLSKAKRRRVGRPSLSKKGTSPRISFRAGSDLYREAQRRAKKEGRTISELAREAFAQYVGHS